MKRVFIWESNEGSKNWDDLKVEDKLEMLLEYISIQEQRIERLYEMNQMLQKMR